MRRPVQWSGSGQRRGSWTISIHPPRKSIKKINWMTFRVISRRRSWTEFYRSGVELLFLCCVPLLWFKPGKLSVGRLVCWATKLLRASVRTMCMSLHLPSSPSLFSVWLSAVHPSGWICKGASGEWWFLKTGFVFGWFFSHCVFIAPLCLFCNMYHVMLK